MDNLEVKDLISQAISILAAGDAYTALLKVSSIPPADTPPRNFNFCIARCCLEIGWLEKAHEAILQELRYYPEDSNSQELIRIIEGKLSNQVQTFSTNHASVLMNTLQDGITLLESGDTAAALLRIDAFSTFNQPQGMLLLRARCLRILGNYDAALQSVLAELVLHTDSSESALVELQEIAKCDPAFGERLAELYQVLSILAPEQAVKFEQNTLPKLLRLVEQSTVNERPNPVN